MKALLKCFFPNKRRTDKAESQLANEAASLDQLFDSFPDLERGRNSVPIVRSNHVEELNLEWCWRRYHRDYYGRSRSNLLLDPLWTFSKLKSLHMTECPCPLDGIGWLKKSLISLSLEHIPRLPDDIRLLCNLETLSLRHCGGLSDFSPSKIQGLIRLQKLTIICHYNNGADKHNYCKDLIGLKDLKELTQIRLSGVSRSTLFNLFSEKPWNGSKFLQWIEVSNCRLGNDYGRILPGLPKGLKELNLDDNGISDLHPFVRGDGGLLPSGIRKLHLTGNPVIGLHNKQPPRQHLNMLLDRYPELRQVSIPFEYVSSQDKAFIRIFYKTLLNQSGRALLEGGSSQQPISLSLWPVVLERVTKKNFKKQQEAIEAYFGLIGGVEGDPFKREYGIFLESLELPASVIFNLLRANPAWMNGRK